jgi:signal transduction histidine kinase
MDTLLHVSQLTRQFGNLTALHQVSFSVAPGEVVGLVGRSGSGKSVLAQILGGGLAPSGGEVLLGGERLRWPFAARRKQVALVPQQPLLADNLDVTQNLFLGAEIGWPGGIGWLRIPNRRRMDRQAREVLAQVDLPNVPLRVQVGNLSSEQRQLLAIARAILAPAQLVILDDPAALLSYSYQQRLLALIRHWQEQGAAVILAGSSLDQVFAVTDRVIVLNEGRKTLDARTDSTSREAVVAALIGQSERRQLTPMIWALENYYNAREQSERLRQQQRRLQQDLAAQDTLNQQLIRQLNDQVKSLDQANLALQDAQRRLLTEREHERKYLARELHDQVIQDLLSVNFELEGLEGEADLTPAHVAAIGEIREGVRDLVDSVRQICGNLRPPTIDSLGLGAALQSYVRDWAARSGITVDLDVEPSVGRLPEEIELSIFRIIQEGLANVRKHARASRVLIRLTPASPRALRVIIADDGRGMEANLDLAALGHAGHYGLIGISERVALLQGRLRLTNSPEGGLRIEAEIPHPRAV